MGGHRFQMGGPGTTALPAGDGPVMTMFVQTNNKYIVSIVAKMANFSHFH